MGLFLFIDRLALVCEWVNFPVLWPHIPVQMKLKCPRVFTYFLEAQLKIRELTPVSLLFLSMGMGVTSVSSVSFTQKYESYNYDSDLYRVFGTHLL